MGKMKRKEDGWDERGKENGWNEKGKGERKWKKNGFDDIQ